MPPMNITGYRFRWMDRRAMNGLQIGLHPLEEQFTASKIFVITQDAQKNTMGKIKLQFVYARKALMH